MLRCAVHTTSMLSACDCGSHPPESEERRDFRLLWPSITLFILARSKANTTLPIFRPRTCR